MSENEIDKPEEVVSSDGGRAVFSGRVIQFFPPKSNFRQEEPESEKASSDPDGIVLAPDSIESELLNRSSARNIFSNTAENESILPFGNNSIGDRFPQQEKFSDGSFFEADNSSDVLESEQRSKDLERGSFQTVLFPSRKEDSDLQEDSETDTLQSGLSDGGFGRNGLNRSNKNDLDDDEFIKYDSAINDDQNDNKASAENVETFSRSSDDSNGGVFFSEFFNDSSSESGDLTKNFEAGLHSVFETESDEEDKEAEDDDALFNNLYGTDLSEDERFQKEETEAQEENLDALIRQNDSDTLYELGAKYGNNFDQDLLSIEEPKNTEVRPESILEAMLFVGDRHNVPLDLKQAVSLMRNVSEDEAFAAIENLNYRYQCNGAPYHIVWKENGYCLELRAEYESVRERFFGKVREFKLSQKSIDLLALIAYRQPISFQEINDFRNGSASILSVLLKRDLIAVEKKTVDKKQISFYRTTDRFLKVFNLGSLDDLPIVEEINYR